LRAVSSTSALTKISGRKAVAPAAPSAAFSPAVASMIWLAAASSASSRFWRQGLPVEVEAFVDFHRFGWLMLAGNAGKRLRARQQVAVHACPDPGADVRAQGGGSKQ